MSEGTFIDDIMRANLSQQQINLIEPRRRNKIQKLLQIKKNEIFQASPQLALKSVQTDIGTVKFTQNDAQKVTKKNKMKEKSIQPLKKKKKAMSCKERKEKNIFKLPKKMDFEKMKSLNTLWNNYILELSKSTNLFSTDSEMLLKADFHGCLMKCIKSKNPSLVDIEGIMIQETQNVFKILEKNNHVKILPKSGCIFEFPLKSEKETFKIKIYGDNFRYRSHDRSRAKLFKKKDIIDL